MAARVMIATWQEDGPAACFRKVRAAAAMHAPIAVRRRRTARSVGAYFDLITREGRLFYGDSFHLGYFSNGAQSLVEALEAHTDLVAGLARVELADEVLDVGCGLAAPAIRMAKRYGCRITGVNISREQVRQGNELISELDLSDRVIVQRVDARGLRFPDESFDAIVCLEAAGDICVTEADKSRLVSDLYRILRPGGHVGFSDLALLNPVSRADDRELRAVLYHSAAELVTDWPTVFSSAGFRIVESHDIIAETLPTWDHVRAVYGTRGDEVVRRYGRRLVARTIAHLERIASILAEHGTFPAFAAHKPSGAAALPSDG